MQKQQRACAAKKKKRKEKERSTFLKNLKKKKIFPLLQSIFLSHSRPQKTSDLLSVNIDCFPDSSVGKESTCNAGDPGVIPGLGRSPGEGIGYPLQYFWASLVAQLVENPPAVRETWVQSLGWKDPPEKRKSTHSSILTWRIPWTIQFMGSQRVK